MTYRSDYIASNDEPAPAPAQSGVRRPSSLLIRDHLEWLVERATSRTRGDISAAAKLLGVDRTTLSQWVNHGLSKKYYSAGKHDS